MFDHMMRRF